jgi:hypothetical protein
MAGSIGGIFKGGSDGGGSTGYRSARYEVG